MTPVLMRVRAELKARWKAWVSLTVMLGLFGGAVIAIAAGARRTDSAYPRFLSWSRAYDLAVPKFIGNGTGPFANVSLRQVERLPRVETSSRVQIYEGPNGSVSGDAPSDPRSFASIERPKLLAGRMPRPDAPLEIGVNWLQARSLKVGVGDTIPVKFFRLHPTRDHPFTTLRLRVVGIEAVAGEFPPHLGNTPAFIMSRAFDRTYRDELQSYTASYLVLKRGFADVSAVLNEVHRLAKYKVLFVLRQDTSAANVERSFHLQAIALWLLAGLSAVVLFLVFGQMLARQMSIESNENTTLNSLGMTRPQLLAVAYLRVAGVAVAGALIAVIVAALASPLFPTGLARVAEPHNGFHLDPLALGIGAGAILLLVAALSAIPAWRSAASEAARTEASSTERASAVGTAVSRTGVSASSLAGVRMALERGRGRTAVPVRTAIAGVTVGIAALSAALTFGASLTHLLGTPALYGVTWDVQVYANQDFATQRIANRLVAAGSHDPRVAAFGLGTTGLQMSVDGVAADAVLIYSRPDGVEPPILSGRPPSASGEIALGPKTLAELHRRVGDTINVGVFGSRPKPMRIVGEAVTPPVGDVGQFGSGALVDYRSAQYLVPGAPAADTLLVRVAPGADAVSVGRAIARRIHGVHMEVTTPQRPNDLVNFGRVQNFPLYLAALVALMAAATLAHVLVTSIRRRRRDLAILKTLGFQRGQLTWTVAWQATTLALVALLIGLPIGVAAGRWIWTSFADQLGILPSPAVPVLAVLVTAPATLLLANLIAYLPGRAAGRVRAATVLRTE